MLLHMASPLSNGGNIVDIPNSPWVTCKDTRATGKAPAHR